MSSIVLIIKAAGNQFYRYKLNHVLFWLIYVIFWTLYTEHTRNYHNRPEIVVITLVFVLGQAPASYLVMYLFIPRYLYKRKYILFLSFYTIVLILSSLVIFSAFYIAHITDAGLAKEVFKPGPFFLYAFLSSVEFVSLLSIYKIVKDAIAKENRNKKLEHEMLQAELNFLKAQINPHFLFNAINSIYFLIKKDQQAACETLIKFSDMLRYQLYECNAEKISLQKELEYLKNYIELEQIRKGHTIKVDVTLPAVSLNLLISPFMLMPLIENAFKYVTNGPDRLNKIDICLSVEDKLLTLCVINTKENVLTFAEVNKTRGIGLNNLKRRLELQYTGKHSLQISPSENLYEATLKITLDEN